MRSIVLGLVVVCLLPTVSGSYAVADERVFGTITSAQSPMTKGIEIWLDGVDKATDGGYPYQLVTDGALLGKGTELSGFADGVVDGGFVTMLYYPTDLPINNMLGNLNLLTTDNRVAAAAVLETVLLDCPSCLDELVDHNIMPLGPYATSPYDLLCTKPGNSLAELKGRSVRAVGTLGQLMGAIGTVPVNLGISEIYEGLQRGQLDCTVFTLGTISDYSLNDVAPYVTRISAGPVYGPTGMALPYDAWSDMDDATRKRFVAPLPEAVTESVYGYAEAEQKVLEHPEAYKLTITERPEDLAKAITAFGDQMLAAKAEELKGRGIANADEIAQTFRDNVKKWEGILATTDNTRQAYAAALKREIYDQFPYGR